MRNFIRLDEKTLGQIQMYLTGKHSSSSYCTIVMLNMRHHLLIYLRPSVPRYERGCTHARIQARVCVRKRAN